MLHGRINTPLDSGKKKNEKELEPNPRRMARMKLFPEEIKTPFVRLTVCFCNWTEKIAGSILRKGLEIWGVNLVIQISWLTLKSLSPLLTQLSFINCLSQNAQ